MCSFILCCQSTNNSLTSLPLLNNIRKKLTKKLEMIDKLFYQTIFNELEHDKKENFKFF
jgi:hypothetical protein